jgi:hypothetical protein
MQFSLDVHEERRKIEMETLKVSENELTTSQPRTLEQTHLQNENTDLNEQVKAKIKRRITRSWINKILFNKQSSIMLQSVKNMKFRPVTHKQSLILPKS